MSSLASDAAPTHLPIVKAPASLSAAGPFYCLPQPHHEVSLHPLHYETTGPNNHGCINSVLSLHIIVQLQVIPLLLKAAFTPSNHRNPGLPRICLPVFPAPVPFSSCALHPFSPRVQTTSAHFDLLYQTTLFLFQLFCALHFMSIIGTIFVGSGCFVLSAHPLLTRIVILPGGMTLHDEVGVNCNMGPTADREAQYRNNGPRVKSDIQKL